MINKNNRNASKQDPMKVKPYARAITTDMIDWKPEVQNNPNILILHCGTNYITKGKKSIKSKNWWKRFKSTKVFTSVAILGVVERKNCLITKQLLTTQDFTFLVWTEASFI